MFRAFIVNDSFLAMVNMRIKSDGDRETAKEQVRTAFVNAKLPIPAIHFCRVAYDAPPAFLVPMVKFA